MTFDQLVDSLILQFDEDQGETVRIANDRHRRMVAEAEWRVTDLSFGNTTIGVSLYNLPVDVVDIRDLEVNGLRYRRTSHEVLRDLQRGTGSLRGNDGAYALHASSTGQRQVELFPTPTAVVPIQVWGASSAPTLAYGAGGALVIPEDFHGYLHAGCRADLFRQADERSDQGPPEDQIFQDGVEKLKRFGRKQFGGPSSRIKVAQFDF